MSAKNQMRIFTIFESLLFIHFELETKYKLTKLVILITQVYQIKLIPYFAKSGRNFVLYYNATKSYGQSQHTHLPLYGSKTVGIYLWTLDMIKNRSFCWPGQKPTHSGA